MTHDYHGTNASRHERKCSKLGPGIITAERLEELLGQDTRTISLMDIAEGLDATVEGLSNLQLVRHTDGTVTAEERGQP